MTKLFSLNDFIDSEIPIHNPNTIIKRTSFVFFPYGCTPSDTKKKALNEEEKVNDWGFEIEALDEEEREKETTVDEISTLVTSAVWNEDSRNEMQRLGEFGIIEQNRGFSFNLPMFVSHSHKDLESNKLSKIRQIFRNHYLNDYIDSERFYRIQDEKSLVTRLENEIKKSRKFIAIITDEYLNSKWCNLELNIAMQYKKPKDILLVLVKPDSADNILSNDKIILEDRKNPLISYIKNMKTNEGNLLEEGYYLFDFYTKQFVPLEMAIGSCLIYGNISSDNAGYYVVNYVDENVCGLMTWFEVNIKFELL